MRLHIGIPWVGFLTCLCIGYAVSQDIPSLKVQLGRSESIAPIVDVGYARYQGSYNSTFNLNVYKGIRYAAAPVGKLRWQAPQKPIPSQKPAVLQATAQPPLCPQSGGAKLPPIYGFNSGPGDEDCLFLNVFAPPEAKNLPVLVWIHGGGYGLFGAFYDPSPLIATSGNGFIAVIIQYRLGAFGFLSSEDVKKYGKVNAGLLDQRFALQWVQDHIQKFGGDPGRVTLGGESAGASSVMLQSIAYGGRQTPSLFDNIIAASVYVYQQFNYNDRVPTQNYLAFLKAAGCADLASKRRSAAFDCLVNADTKVLQNASGEISESGGYGTFAFVPVTDGDLIPATPSQQLYQKAVSGKRLLISNTANEGAPLAPSTILTARGFSDYVDTTFPFLTREDKTRLAQLYSIDTLTTDLSAPLFDTTGDRPPTALNQSVFATGQKQRVYNFFGEAVFYCPGYQFAEAFSGSPHVRQAWRYQYSVTGAYHGADLNAIFSLNVTSPTPGFIHAFQKIWSNFIINNTPIISVADARANASNATVPEGSDGKINWPNYDPEKGSVQMSLNSTGGIVTFVPVTPDFSYPVRLGPGVVNEFRLGNADTWEGGRGDRCRFWREIAPRVPN